VLLSGWSVAIAQTKPASSRAQATTIFCGGLPRPAIRCQLVEPLLATPGALDHGGLLAALAASELVADLRPSARVPGSFDQEPAHMRIADPW
jgi:hypothetical protein